MHKLYNIVGKYCLILDKSLQLQLTQLSKTLNPLHWRVREWQIFIKNLCLIAIAKSLLISIKLLKNIIDIQVIILMCFFFRNVYKLHIIIAGIHNAFSLPPSLYTFPTSKNIIT